MHNKLNNTHMALMHFSWAMDLDPKGANSQIKDALDPTINSRAAGGQEENAPGGNGGGGGAESAEPAGEAGGGGSGGEDEAADDNEEGGNGGGGGTAGEAMVQGGEIIQHLYPNP